MKKKFRALKRSALSLLLALTMTLSFLPAYAQAEGEENLLTDGGFESDIWDSNSSSWSFVPETWDNTTISWSSSSSHEGSYSVNYSTGSEQTITVSQSVVLEAGTYSLSAYNQGNGCNYQLFCGENAGQAITLTGWGTWDATEYTFTVSESGTYTVGAYLNCDANGRGYLDNMFLVKASESSSSQGYSISAVPNTTDIKTGETVNIDISVTYNGTAITDLAKEGLNVSTWLDSWNDHGNGNSDALISESTTLTPTVTMPSEGTYYIVTELYDSEWESLASTLTTFEVSAATADDDTAVAADINVEKVSNLSDDFIMGMDISSVMSEFASGVTYQDFEGNEIKDITAFCQFLKECGVTHIRVRVWNDPYTDDEKGYGGGNNDIDTAVEIAEGCQAAGLKMLVDFHCSDFWTDPGKQQAPKDWTGLDVDGKAAALKTFLSDSLNEINNTGVKIAMVQIGNETINAFIGESDVTDMCKLFSAGTEAVRTFNTDNNTDIKTVIHVTNPESSYMTTWAKNLNDNNVKYDILATSYYPSWHGTFDNLKSQLQTVKSTYRKDVMVAETSYAFTLDDTDGHDNTIREDNNDTMLSGKQYPFSPQGQASYLRDLIDVVNSAGGLGVYYWESAWITVGDTTGLTGDDYNTQVEKNKNLWETHGSGWASSYSANYEPNDAGKWYGGSAVDNQALFAADGSPLASINVWNLVKTGAVSIHTSVEAIESPAETIEVGEKYTLPETVKVTYSNETLNENVKWNQEEIAAIDTNIPGTYTITGTVTFSKQIDTGEYAEMTESTVIYKLTVKEKNLIGDDWSFENGNSNFGGLNSTGKGIDGETPYDGNKCLHWFLDNAATSIVTYNGSDNNGITLQPGSYTFECVAQGKVGDTVTLKVINYATNEVLETGEAVFLNDWKNWTTPSVTFSIAEETTIALQMEIGIQNGGWGTIDCMYLYQSGEGQEKTEYVDNISSYRDSNSTYTAPKKEGYIFAGWYRNADCTVPVDENVISGGAYAKYVDEDVLTVKYQIPTTTTAESPTTILRLVTSIDKEDYQSVTFQIEYNGSINSISTSTAYRNLIGFKGEEKITYNPDVFSADSKYMVALNVNDVLQSAYDDEFKITPQWLTADGTPVSGKTRTIVIKQSTTFNGGL